MLLKKLVVEVIRNTISIEMTHHTSPAEIGLKNETQGVVLAMGYLLWTKVTDICSLVAILNQLYKLSKHKPLLMVP